MSDFERTTTINKSPIHGYGLFAAKNFSKDQRIMTAILPQADYHEGIDLMKYFGRTNDKEEYIKLGCLEFSVLRYLNHSSKPNAEYLDCVDNNTLLLAEYELIALEDIAEGEEITINYDIDNFN